MTAKGKKMKLNINLCLLADLLAGWLAASCKGISITFLVSC